MRSDAKRRRSPMSTLRQISTLKYLNTLGAALWEVMLFRRPPWQQACEAENSLSEYHGSRRVIKSKILPWQGGFYLAISVTTV